MDDAKYIDDKVREAIATMRNFCDQAERDLSMYENSPTEKPACVMHQLAWGMANASSSLETAMNHVSRMHEFLKLDMKELEKKGN